jgi:hypothetical protein
VTVDNQVQVQVKVAEAAVVLEQARQQRTVDNQVQVQVKVVLEYLEV